VSGCINRAANPAITIITAWFSDSCIVIDAMSSTHHDVRSTAPVMSICARESRPMTRTIAVASASTARLKIGPEYRCQPTMRPTRPYITGNAGPCTEKWVNANGAGRSNTVK
jgi:hypothetical protein